MAINKPSRAGLDRKRESVSHMREKLRRVEVGAKRKGTPEWEAQKKDLQDIVDGVGYRVFELLEAATEDPASTLCELKKMAGQRATADMLIESVEKADQLATSLREKIDAIEREIVALEAELEQTA